MKEAVRRILEEAEANPHLAWQQEVGIVRSSVRLDINLRQHSSGILHQLGWLGREFQRLCVSVERLDDEAERVRWLAAELGGLRQKLARRPRRPG